MERSPGAHGPVSRPCRQSGRTLRRPAMRGSPCKVGARDRSATGCARTMDTPSSRSRARSGRVPCAGWRPRTVVNARAVAQPRTARPGEAGARGVARAGEVTPQGNGTRGARSLGPGPTRTACRRRRAADRAPGRRVGGSAVPGRDEGSVILGQTGALRASGRAGPCPLRRRRRGETARRGKTQVAARADVRARRDAAGAGRVPEGVVDPAMRLFRGGA